MALHLTKTGKALAVAGAVGVLTACSAGSATPNASQTPDAAGTVRSVSDVSDSDTPVVTTIDKSGRILHLTLGGYQDRLTLPQAPCPGQDPDDPQFADQTITWTRLDGGASLPMSTTDGPEGFVGGWVGAGFTQTARGAALAGIHLIESASLGGMQATMMLGFATAAPIHDQTFIDDQALYDMRERTGVAANSGLPSVFPDSMPAPPWAVSLGHVAAYKVSTTPQEDGVVDAVVDYAVPTGDTFTTHRYVLHWREKQWNLEVGIDGPTTAISTTTDLAGWTRFPDAGNTILTCNEAG